MKVEIKILLLLYFVLISIKVDGGDFIIGALGKKANMLGLSPLCDRAVSIAEQKSSNGYIQASNGNFLGQSFKPIASKISGISIFIDSIESPETLELILHEGSIPFNGPLNTLGSATCTIEHSGEVFFRFDSPITVISGNDYYFSINTYSHIKFKTSNADPYAAGTSGIGSSRNQLNENTNLDLNFSVYFCPVCDDIVVMNQQLESEGYVQVADGTFLAQSFRPNATKISGISIFIDSIESPQTLQLYLHKGSLPFNGPLNILGSATSYVEISGEAFFNFGSPIYVTPGDDYYFSFNGVNTLIQFSYSTSNPYPDGIAGIGSARNLLYGLDGNQTADLKFTTYYCLADTIPTISQWGILLLSLFLLIIGVVVDRQRKGNFEKKSFA